MRTLYPQTDEKLVPEPRRFSRHEIDARKYRLLGSPESWGLPITVTSDECVLEGYCNQIAECGLRAFLREEVPVGTAVALHFVVPSHSTELHMRAVVRYRVGFQHGLEFASLNEREREAIRQFCNELP